MTRKLVDNIFYIYFNNTYRFLSRIDANKFDIFFDVFENVVRQPPNSDTVYLLTIVVHSMALTVLTRAIYFLCPHTFYE